LQMNAIIADGTAPTGLTVNGPGILDLSDGNNNQTTNTFTGPTVVNGAVVLIDNDLNFGTAPATSNTAAIVLNGGEVRSTKGVTLSGNRGITVGPQGGI